MKNKIIYIGLVALAAVSCMKDIAPDANLGVKLSEGRYKVGEPVTFQFEGDPDNIVFYSGENGHMYENRHRTEGDCDIFVDFKTYVRSNVANVYDNLRILVSTDFNGVYDQAGVEAATWTDLTDQFRFSTGSDNYPSGELKLNEYVGKGSFFIAFKYTGKGNQWIVRTADVVKVTPEGVKNTLGTMSTMGWTVVDCGNPNAGVDKTNFSRLYFDGNAAGNGEDNNDWIISKPMDSKGLVPDTGVALKNLSTVMSEFTYTYYEPGTYKAVFETSSVWYDDSKYSLTEVEVTVVGDSEVEPDPVPVLTLTSNKSEYNVGEAAEFTLSGNGVSNITFWSGDAGNDWEFRDTYGRLGGALGIKFNTMRRGSGDAKLQFRVSQKFNGQFTAENIKEDEWIDLTDKFTFATGTTITESNVVKLSEYLTSEIAEEPVYIAFRYVGKKLLWSVKSVFFTEISPAGELGEFEKIGTGPNLWTAVSCADDAKKWTVTSDQLLFNLESTTYETDNDDWVIYNTPVVSSKILGPDKGEVINELGTKSYTFKTAGNYTVVVDYFDGKSWKQATTSVTVR